MNTQILATYDRQDRGLLISLFLLLSACFVSVNIASAQTCVSSKIGSSYDLGCEKSHKLSGLGFFDLYSNSGVIRADSIEADLRLESTNDTLSPEGPRASAELALSCKNSTGPALTLSFPGYPMFVENDNVEAVLIVDQQKLLGFSASMGNDLFQIRVNDRVNLKKILVVLTKRQFSNFSIVSTDQDGSKVHAHFHYSGESGDLAEITNICLGMV